MIRIFLKWQLSKNWMLSEIGKNGFDMLIIIHSSVDYILQDVSTQTVIFIMVTIPLVVKGCNMNCII